MSSPVCHPVLPVVQFDLTSPQKWSVIFYFKGANIQLLLLFLFTMRTKPCCLKLLGSVYAQKKSVPCALTLSRRIPSTSNIRCSSTKWIAFQGRWRYCSLVFKRKFLETVWIWEIEFFDCYCSTFYLRAKPKVCRSLSVIHLTLRWQLMPRTDNKNILNLLIKPEITQDFQTLIYLFQPAITYTDLQQPTLTQTM